MGSADITVYSYLNRIISYISIAERVFVDGSARFYNGS